jgi:hypothetical protein
MTDTELSALRDAIANRLAVVADHELRAADPAAHLEKLKQAASRVDALATNLPKDCDPMLRHYVERQSYVKALTWLDERLGQ